MNAKKLRAALSKELRELLGEDVPDAFLDPQMIRLLSEGHRISTTNARIIAEKVMELARNGDRWAIEFLADRTEGKAAQSVANEEGDRQLNEALHDVTVKHLNDLASAFDLAGGTAGAGAVGANPLTAPVNQQPDRDEDRAGERAPGQVSPLLDLPEDRNTGSQNPAS